MSLGDGFKNGVVDGVEKGVVGVVAADVIVVRNVMGVDAAVLEEVSGGMDG